MEACGHLEGPPLFFHYPLTEEAGCAHGSAWKLYGSRERVLFSDLYPVNISVAPVYIYIKRHVCCYKGNQTALVTVWLQVLVTFED